MNKLVTTIGILAVIALLFFVAGPRLLTHLINTTPPPMALKTAPIKIKASGTLSLVDNHIVLTTPHGKNNYILVGNRQSELKDYADKKESLFIFGRLMTPEPKKIGDLKIRYRIDVDEFDTKDFEIGQKMSSQIADSIKTKIAEKTAFRDATMKKLGIKDIRLDVLSGKLYVMQGVIYAGNPKEHFGLMVIDNYGDAYLLYDASANLKPYEKFKKYLNTNMEVVVLGQISLPDPAVVFPGTANYIPFSARKLYNKDLTEFVVEQAPAPEKK